MEKALGIICEFNPFHNGHQYLFDRAHTLFPEHALVCVMSSDFVQRGSFAVMEKYKRAKCAVQCGADLVLELPFPFSCLSAEAFAGSAVSLLGRTGLCDTLLFGTEAGRAEEITAIARNLLSSEFAETLSNLLKNEPKLGFPAAREKAYTELFGETALLSQPNSALAVEYATAILREKLPLSLVSVKRAEGENIRSASEIRELIFNGGFGKVKNFVPQCSFNAMLEEREAGRFPISEESLSQTLLFLLRTKSKQELSALYGFAPFAARAKAAADDSASFSELLQKLANRKFTDSRIRRALIAVLCNIPKFAEKEKPAYSLILAASKRGTQLLSEGKASFGIPVFTKAGHISRSTDRVVLRRQSAAFLAEKVYTLAFPAKHNANFSIMQTPYIEK